MLKPARLLTESEAASMPERWGAVIVTRKRKYSDRLLAEGNSLAISLGKKKPALKKACDRIGIPVNRLRRFRRRARIQGGFPPKPYGPKPTYTPEQERTCCLLALRYKETKGWPFCRAFLVAGRQLGMNGRLIQHKWREGYVKI